MHDSPVIDRIAGSADVASCLSAALTQDSPAGFGHEPGNPSPDATLQPDGARAATPKSFDMSRWTCDVPRAWNTHVQQPEILVALCLRQAALTLSADGAPFLDGVIDRGAILVVPPGIELSGTFHTPADFLHVHVPSRWLTEWLNDDDVSTPSSLLAGGPLHVRDSVVIKLTGTLLRALLGRASSSSMYADGIVLSMLARLLEIIVARVSAKPVRVPSVSPLEAWRAKIAIEFIDQRIDRSLSLAELGAAVGLSPMHFAARFRAATGISPHAFILRRRIEHAQTLLATTRSTVAEIAFSVGFRTQAHFTTVFRHHVDDTPHRWRAKHGTLQMTTARALRR